MSNVPSLWYHYILFSFDQKHNFSPQAFSDNPIWLIERKGKRMIYWVVLFWWWVGAEKVQLMEALGRFPEMLILPKASVQCWFITIGQESVPEKRQKVNLASLYFYFLVSVGITHWVINNQTKLGPSFTSTSVWPKTSNCFVKVKHISLSPCLTA